MKKIIVVLLAVFFSSCVEYIEPTINPFVVINIRHADKEYNLCIYEGKDYVVEIIDTCNKYKIGDTIKFTK